MAVRNALIGPDLPGPPGDTSGNAGYTFLPWVRRGLAAAISATDTHSPGLPSTVVVPVDFKVNSDQVHLSARLYGPADVVSLDTRQIVRTDPAPRSADFEPNFFASIEFADATFPWLFTPLGDTRTQQLRPWLCLVVVEQGPDVTLTPETPSSLAVLQVRDPDRQLPNLAESWAWAHGQVVAGGDQDWQKVLEDSPTQTLSRLVCPRRLAPGTSYIACLVPTFEVGRLAGLGQDVTVSDLRPAWQTPAPNPPAPGSPPVVLPVYHYWEFRTSTGGDFESMVRPLWQNVPAELGAGFGTRPVDASRPGCGLDWTGLVTLLEGVLCAPPCAAPPPPPAGVQRDLAGLLQASAVHGIPIVGPPLYGGWYALQPGLPASGWMRDLNLDPCYRVAAALGALVVHDNQEQLMASAWDQLAGLRQANQALAQAQLARTVNSDIHARRLSSLGSGPLLQVTQPVHSRVATSPITLSSVITESRVPDAALTPSFRRAVRPQGPLARRFGPPGDTVAGLDAGLLVTAPDRHKPDGAVSIADVNALLTNPPGCPGMAALTPGLLQAAPGWAPPPASSPGPDVRWAAAPADQAIPRPPRFGDLAAGDLQTMAAGFRQAATAQLQYLQAALALPGERLQGPALAPGQQQQTLLDRIHPEVTVTAAARAAISVEPRTWDRPDPLDPVTTAPQFPVPMADVLAELGQDLLLPGLSAVPPDSVVALQANPRFIEAFMVGLNQEMGRELLWRGFPSHPLATYFRRFWADEQSAQRGDIPPIQQWDGQKRLGDNSADWSAPPLALVIRSRLFQRYPNAAVYAAKAVEARDGSRAPGSPESYPVASGRLDPDLRFFLFDLPPDQAAGTTSSLGDQLGWFFVIQQHPTEPRFGLEPAAAADFGRDPTTWALVTWGNLVDSQAALDELSCAPASWRGGGSLTLPPGPVPPPGPTWGAGSDSAQFAAITLRRPLRVAIHASALLPSGAKSGA